MRTKFLPRFLPSLTLPPVKLQDYANVVRSHSEQSVLDSLYPGPNFANLASSLAEPFHIRAPCVAAPSCPPDTYAANEEFVAFYRLSKCGKDSSRYLKTPDELARIEQDIQTSAQQIGSEDSQHPDTEGRLLFLRGHASPEWINRIGASYSVDPEVFNRHRDFAAIVGRTDHFTSFSLPSTNLNMLRTRFITLDRRTSKTKPGTLSQKDLDGLRQKTHDALGEYFDKLSTKRGDEVELGSSIVRCFSLHDSEHFSIEQDASIYLTKAERGWIGMHRFPCSLL